jgi:hypothetical protein
MATNAAGPSHALHSVNQQSDKLEGRTTIEPEEVRDLAGKLGHDYDQEIAQIQQELEQGGVFNDNHTQEQKDDVAAGVLNGRLQREVMGPSSGDPIKDGQLWGEVVELTRTGRGEDALALAQANGGNVEGLTGDDMEALFNPDAHQWGHQFTNFTGDSELQKELNVTIHQTQQFDRDDPVTGAKEGAAGADNTGDNAQQAQGGVLLFELAAEVYEKEQAGREPATA